jgi:hypothetical protein
VKRKVLYNQKHQVAGGTKRASATSISISAENRAANGSIRDEVMAKQGARVGNHLIASPILWINRLIRFMERQQREIRELQSNLCLTWS